jgi:hypothetical protein
MEDVLRKFAGKPNEAHTESLYEVYVRMGQNTGYLPEEKRVYFK